VVGSGGIRLAGLRREFGDVVAVDGLDLVIPAGEIYGLIGPNGAGKTTTIRMACGLLAPTAGRVLIEGIDVHREPERAHQFIGYLSDTFALYEDLLVWEYLDYFANAYRLPPAEVPARIDEVIRLVGLEGKRNELTRGLSRGMRQRLGLARAMIHHPRVLLLDEPASGLDPKARVDLRGLLRRLREAGTTILVSSHILSDLDGFCTSIGIMEQGRLIRTGTVAEISGRADAARTVRLAWMPGPHRVTIDRLGDHAGVADVTAREGEATFRFSGTDAELAALLATLVAAGLPVVFFGEMQQSIEDVYMRLSGHRVT
jgi:ABC-2 type transport system ATP-binding protein